MSYTGNCIKLIDTNLSWIINLIHIELFFKECNNWLFIFNIFQDSQQSQELFSQEARALPPLAASTEVTSVDKTAASRNVMDVLTEICKQLKRLFLLLNYLSDDLSI